MSWLFDDACEYREQAQRVLDRVKRTRSGRTVRYERIDDVTWVERDLTPKPKTIEKTMEQTVTRQEAEQAVAIYRTAKSARDEYETQMADAERIVETFGRQHYGEFVDGRLELDSGTLAVRAGVAKPLKAGRPLTTAARAELASELPQAYVRLSCDFAQLYACGDKLVRQLLRARDIEIVREDKFAIL